MGAEGFDLGRSVPFHEARDPVNLPMQRRWCDAVGVTNPVYLDSSVAERSRFDGIISPLAMTDVWLNPGLAYERDPDDPIGGAFQTLEAEGFTSSVAVSSVLDCSRPLRLGEGLRSTVLLESVSEEKHTALGPSRFVTSRRDILSGPEVVARSWLTVMKFRPAGEQRRAAERATAEDRPQPLAPQRDDLGTVRASSLRMGAFLPPLTIPITPTLIIAGALMTNDYYEGHHDRDAAVARGSRDIFMNIHTTLGLLQRFVGDWLGPNARWHGLRVRLGVPNYPGDVMTMTAEVTAVDPGGRVTIAVRAINELGAHATATAEITLPG
jgi:hypothetical protein